MKSVAAFALLYFVLELSSSDAAQRSFEVDWGNGRFLKDGEVFRYVSGSLHYSRIPHSDWSDRLVKMKAAGLNAVETYVLWNFHSSQRGHYDFSADRDVETFLRLANDTGLLVIVRGFPYACAEWEFGGLPWFVEQFDNIRVRSSDPQFLTLVDEWLDVILPKLEPFLYQNGGPIITVQFENEYGTFIDTHGCDDVYLNHLVDKMHEHLGDDVVLFTTDRAYTVRALNCGALKSQLATVDFKVTNNPEKYFRVAENFQSGAPLVNSEFYTGKIWFFDLLICANFFY